MTRNLYDFLEQFRELSKKDGKQQDASTSELEDAAGKHGCETSGFSTTLWIDAICISQNDTNEKNRQVALMTEIYRNASEVVIWLGKQSPSSGLALRVLQGWSDLIEGLPESRTTAWCRNDLARTFQEEDDSSIERKVSAVSELIQRPWFERAWTFQEVTLAQSATLMCGGECISWWILVQAFDCVSKAGLPWRVFDTNPNVKTLVKFWTLGKVVDNASDSYRLSYMLHFTDRQRATDPRDKLYSLLGIIRGSSSERAEWVEANCPIVYEESVTTVFIKYATLMINSDVDLRILSQCYRGQGAPVETDLPSWVPDWRVPVSVMPLRQLHLPSIAWPDLAPGSHGAHLASNRLHMEGCTLAQFAIPTTSMTFSRVLIVSLAVHCLSDRWQRYTCQSGNSRKAFHRLEKSTSLWSFSKS